MFAAASTRELGSDFLRPSVGHKTTRHALLVLVGRAQARGGTAMVADTSDFRPVAMPNPELRGRAASPGSSGDYPKTPHSLPLVMR
jgi:hypothetical protein